MTVGPKKALACWMLTSSWTGGFDEEGTALMVAAERGDYESFRRLLDAGADVNKTSQLTGTALIVAISEGQHDIARMLLEHHHRQLNINARGEWSPTALTAAAKGGSLEFVNSLLRFPDIEFGQQDGSGEDALQKSSRAGPLEIVKALLKEYVQKAARQIMPLDPSLLTKAFLGAAESGHDEVIELLVRKGVSVCAEGGHYGNALQAAAYNGHLSTVKLLLRLGEYTTPRTGDRGRRKRIQDMRGGEYHSTLQAAACQGHGDIFDLLLPAEVEEFDVDKIGGTAGSFSKLLSTKAT